jgi:hypothetical protein
MKKFLVSMFLLLVTSYLSVAGENPKQKNWGFDYGYTYLGCTVNNMPYEIRKIPIHRDDVAWTKDYSLVEKTEYQMNHAFTIGVLYGREVTFTGHARPSINFSIGLDWMIYPFTAIGGDVSEETYQGEGREIGSALTYVALRQNGIIPSCGNVFTDIIFNWTPRAKFEFAPLGDICNRLWLGTSISYYSLDAQNGWDRYSTLEPNKEYKLADVIPIRVYGVWFLEDNTDFGFTAGAQFQQSSTVGLGKKADVEIVSPTYYIGFSGRY